MSDNFHEPFNGSEVGQRLPPDRSTGLVLAGASLAVALFQHENRTALVSGLAVAVILAAVSLLYPRLLRPLNIAWMGLARILHAVVNPVIMGVLFFLVIMPFGLIMRLRYDPLRSKGSRSSTSFWLAPKSQDAAGGMENQF